MKKDQQKESDSVAKTQRRIDALAKEFNSPQTATSTNKKNARREWVEPTEHEIKDYLDTRINAFHGNKTSNNNYPVMHDLLHQFLNDTSGKPLRPDPLRSFQDAFELKEGWASAAFDQIPKCKRAFVGALHDAWIFFLHLKLAYNDEESNDQAHAYLNFFKSSLEAPDAWKALISLEPHYQNKSKDQKYWNRLPFIPDEFDVSPYWRLKEKLGNTCDLSRFGDHKQRRKELGFGSKRNPTELELEQAQENIKTLLMLMKSTEQECHAYIKGEGLAAVVRAACNGDMRFLGVMISCYNYKHSYTKTTLSELVKLPWKGKVSARTWCRRFWFSRGIWKMEPSMLGFSPLNINEGSTRSNITTTHEAGDALYRSATPFLVSESGDGDTAKWKDSDLIGAKSEYLPLWRTLTIDYR